MGSIPLDSLQSQAKTEFCKLKCEEGGDGRSRRHIIQGTSRSVQLRGNLRRLDGKPRFSASFFLILSLTVKLLISTIWSGGLPGFVLENERRV